jgi:biopolymer transport protein TolQ
MEPQSGLSIFSMVESSGIVVQAVLFILIGLSIGSWTITIAKLLQFSKARKESEEFSALFWESRNLARVEESSTRLSSSPLAQVFVAGARELRVASQDGTNKSELVERALRRAELKQSHILENGITFLATVASAAPFIGLFGTVWGIMNAFHGLSSVKNSTLQAVAPGISEALVATAIGLAAAIPAAIAYNYFAVDVRKFRESMDKFSEEFLSLAKGLTK